jgi:hypothetical protein
MTRWRRWVLPLGLVALVAVAAVVVVLLAPPAKTNTYLDPSDGGLFGASALSDLLGERGQQVVKVYSVHQALGSLGSPASSMLLVTSPDLLTRSERATVARVHADLVLVAAGPTMAQTVAPGLSVKNYLPATLLRPPLPRCALTAARLAGSADLSPGYAYAGTVPADAVRCYPAAGAAALLWFTAGGRSVILLGSGQPLTNIALADHGNAALALNLLAGRQRIVWLTPEPPGAAAFPGVPGAGRGGSGPGLLPRGVDLLVWELVIAVALAAIWRARRFGPLITERLPVVVRASETVEGHARLYQARRSRGRAAAALRNAMLARVLPALSMAAGSAPDAVAPAVASRSRQSEPEVRMMIYGPDPATDAELVQLADSLDELEKEVRSL